MCQPQDGHAQRRRGGSGSRSGRSRPATARSAADRRGHHSRGRGPSGMRGRCPGSSRDRGPTGGRRSGPSCAHRRPSGGCRPRHRQRALDMLGHRSRRGTSDTDYGSARHHHGGDSDMRFVRLLTGFLLRARAIRQCNGCPCHWCSSWGVVGHCMRARSALHCVTERERSRFRGKTPRFHTVYGTTLRVNHTKYGNASAKFRRPKGVDRGPGKRRPRSAASAPRQA